MNDTCSSSAAGRAATARCLAAALLIVVSICVARPQEIGRLQPPLFDNSRDTVKRLIAERAYPQAEAELARLLVKTPGDHELTVLQALNFFHEHKYVESRQVVARLVAAHAATAEVRVLSGLLYVVGNELGSAELEFRSATDADGNNAAAHYYLGRTLYMRQAIDPSVVEFKRAIALDPNFIQAYDALGLAFFVKEDPAEAQVWFLRGMQQEQLHGGPKMDWLRLDLATMLLTYHRSQEAAQYLEEAERINATNPQVHMELGQMYFQERRYADAISAYGQALRLDPSNATAHYFRGRAYHLLNQKQRAKEEFASFIALNRQHEMYDKVSLAANPRPDSKDKAEELGR